MSAPIPNTPIVNLGLEYIFGLELTYLTATTLRMAVGQARSQYNVNDIVLSSAATLNTAASGANGLDTGTIAASTKYAIHVIGSSTDMAPTAIMISLSATNPYLPLNYDMFCRVGYLYTDVSSNIVKGRWEGHSSERTFWYDTGISGGAAVTSTTYLKVDLSGSIPEAGTTAILNLSYNAAVAGDTFAARPTGSSSTNGIVIGGNPVAAKPVPYQYLVPVGADGVTGLAAVDFKVTASGSLAIIVDGYVDHLLATVPSS